MPVSGRVTRGLGLAMGVAIAGMLSGCGSSGSGGSGSVSDAMGNLLAFNSTKAPEAVAAVNMDEAPTCPDIDILDGTASDRVYGAGEQTNANVRHQFSMGNAERECSHVGDQLVLKVGVEGRVLLGPVGSPGSFTAPVRIAVRRESDSTVVSSKLYPVAVTIPGGEIGAPFSVVSEPIGVPFTTPRGSGSDYTIVVGFDSKGDGTISGKSRKPARTRRHAG